MILLGVNLYGLSIMWRDEDYQKVYSLNSDRSDGLVVFCNQCYNQASSLDPSNDLPFCQCGGELVSSDHGSYVIRKRISKIENINT